MNGKANRPRTGNARGGGNGNGSTYSKNSTKGPKGQPIYAADGETVIGYVVGTVFYKHVRGSRHMLRRPPAWALDVCALDQLHAAGAVRFVFRDTETGKAYSTSLAHFERNCSRPFNRGFGPQVFLALGFWHVDGQPPALGDPEPGEGSDPSAPVQLALFG